jgi:hypothetical protein
VDEQHKQWELDFVRLGDGVTLYAVELRCGDRTIQRLTDRLPEIGDSIRADDTWWTVLRIERAATDIAETARFLCDVTLDQRQRAVAMRAEDREMRAWLEALWTRLGSLRRRIGG